MTNKERSQTNIFSNQYTTAIRRRSTVSILKNLISKSSYESNRWIRLKTTSEQIMYCRNLSRRAVCLPPLEKLSFWTLLLLSLCLVLYQSELTWANCTFMDGQCTYNIRLAPPGVGAGNGDGVTCSPGGQKETKQISGTLQSQNDYAEQMTNIVKDFDYMKDDHEKRIKELEHYVLKLLGRINPKSDIALTAGNIQAKLKQGSVSESGSVENEVFNGVTYSNSDDDRLIKKLHKEFTNLRTANKEKAHKLRIINFQLNETRQKLRDTQDTLVTTTEQLVNAEQTLSVLQDDKYILQNRLKDKSERLYRAEKRLTAMEKRSKAIDEQLLTLIRSENNLKEELHTYKYRLNDTVKKLKEMEKKYNRLNQDYSNISDELVLREKELMVCVKAKTQSFCGFEDDNICGFTQVNETDNFDWTRAKGNTPSADTGPEADHTCKSEEGHFMHLEASAKGRGHTAVLKSPTYKSFTAQCVQFYYHMYGRHMGTLNVYTQSASESDPQAVWRAYGNQGNVWIKARLSIPLNLAKSGYHVVFEGSTETGYQGDMAIDDITVDDGECPIDPHLRPVVVPDITTRASFNWTAVRSKKRRRKKPRAHSHRRRNGTHIITV